MTSKSRPTYDRGVYQLKNGNWKAMLEASGSQQLLDGYFVSKAEARTALEAARARR